MRRTFANPSRRSRTSVLLTLGLTVTVLVGCGRDDADDARASQGSVSEQDQPDETTTTTTAPTTTTTAPTTTTTVPTTTTTAPPPPPPPAPPPVPGADADGVLSPGESGEFVLALQQRLTELGYWLGGADGGYGQTTQQAVLAFQKAEGLGRDGVAGADTLNRLQTAGRVTAASTAGDLIEFDLARQLLFVVDDGQVVWAINTSTGKASTPTPAGQFTVTRQINGMRHAELGNLWRPKYFTGGIAIHGFDSVPGYPASHGCTRVSDAAMNWLWDSGLAELGTPVWVH